MCDNKRFPAGLVTNLFPLETDPCGTAPHFSSVGGGRLRDKILICHGCQIVLSNWWICFLNFRGFSLAAVRWAVSATVVVMLPTLPDYLWIKYPSIPPGTAATRPIAAIPDNVRDSTRRALRSVSEAARLFSTKAASSCTEQVESDGKSDSGTASQSILCFYERRGIDFTVSCCVMSSDSATRSAQTLCDRLILQQVAGRINPKAPPVFVFKYLTRLVSFDIQQSWAFVSLWFSAADLHFGLVLKEDDIFSQSCRLQSLRASLSGLSCFFTAGPTTRPSSSLPSSLSPHPLCLIMSTWFCCFPGDTTVSVFR